MVETIRFPVLYRKGSTDKVRTWEIYVDNRTIVTETGLIGGKLQESEEVIKEGKNLGQANETTPHEQAVKEAQSRWQFKKDKGYSESLEAAENGVDEITGGYFPMLAKVYDPSKFGDPYPLYHQPKLDGLRATLDGGRFYSRTRKPFRDIPHLRQQLASLNLENEPLDGELYCHELKDDFEQIVSAIKRGSTDHPLLSKIEYHVYDVNLPGWSYTERYGWLLARIPILGSQIKLVPAGILKTPEEVDMWHDHYVDQGYEGLMLRTPEGKYLSDSVRRSGDLLKVKLFSDDEFKIVGFTEGRGKLAGHVGSFVCKHGDETFEVKLEGKQDFLKQCFKDHPLWSGRWMTVQYQGFTNKKNVPRFPVGLRLRETE